MKQRLIPISFLALLLITNQVQGDEGMSGAINLSKDAVVAIVGRAEDSKFVILGTGFFVDEKGTIATCDHIIKPVPRPFIMKPQDLEKSKLLGYVTTKDKLPQLNLPVYQASADAAFIPAQVLERSSEEDIALLKVDQRPTSHLRAGSYSLIEEGNDLIFLGFPFGFNRVVTHKGMVSYKGEINVTGTPGGKAIAAVQIDGIVNRGSSGSPLISVSQGKVVGIVKATHGSVGPYLQAINEGKIQTRGIGLGQIDFGVFTREVSAAIDRHIQMGIGYAISADYLADIQKKAEAAAKRKKK